MPRSEGFAVMDVSTDVVNDPKFRRLHRDHPEHVAVAFTVYMAVLAESWKAGGRVSANDAWPIIVQFESTVVDSMVEAKLLDSRGRVPAKTWDGWFIPAMERRAKARDRWARYNAQRNAEQTSLPRGSDAATASSVPSVPSVRSAPSGQAEQDGTPLDDGSTIDGRVKPWRKTA